MKAGVAVLRSLSEIEAVREDWIRLQSHPNSDFHVYRVALSSSSSVIRPHVLVAWSEGVVTAILAGRLEKARLNLRLGYWDVPAPAATTLVFIHGGLLGDATPALCALFTKSIMETLRSGEADRAFFNHIRTDSALFGAVRQVPPFYACDPCPSLQVHRRMKLPDSVTDFRSRFSRKVRSTLKWQANRLFKDFHGDLRIARLGSPETFEAMMRDVESVAAKAYQRALSGGFGDTPQDRERLQLKAQKGLLRTYILYVEDQPWAFWMGTLYGTTFHSEYMGFDPSHRKYSPGKYLMMRVIEELCSPERERSISAIDFGLGDAEYKRTLADEEWVDSSPNLFAPTLRGIRLNLYRMPFVWLDRISRRVLGRALEGRLKHLWRRRIEPRLSASGLARKDSVSPVRTRE